MHTRRWMAAVALFATLGLAGVACGSDSYQAAPDFSMTDENPISSSHGETRSLAQELGKVLVLHFVAFT